MNRKTRILSLFLAVVMMFSAVPLSAIAYTTDGGTDDTAAPTFTTSASTGEIHTIYANGTSIVLDRDASNPDDTNIYLWDENGNKLSEYKVKDATSIYGTAKTGSYDNVKITIKAGNFGTVLGAATNMVADNVELTLEGGTVKVLNAGVTAASIANAVINVKGGEVTNCVSPGANAKAVKNVEINVTGGSVAKICAAGQTNTKASYYTGKTIVNVTGGSVAELYCGTDTTTTYAQADIEVNVDDNATVPMINAVKGLVAGSSTVALSVGENYDLAKITGITDVAVTVGSSRLVTGIDCGVTDFELEAEYGTAIEDIEGLPTQVTYTLSGGAQATVAAVWDTQYQPTVPGTHTFILLPTTGYKFYSVDTSNVAFNVTLAESNDKKHVTAITAPDMLEVAYMTAKEDISFPTTLDATVDIIGASTQSGVEYTIPFITWVSDEYNPLIEGDYTFTAVLPGENQNYTYADGVDNVTLMVRVLESTEPKIVDLGRYPNEVKIPLGSLTEFKLPESAEVKLEDDTKITVNFTGWNVTDEEGNVAVIDLTKTGVYYYTPDFMSVNRPANDVTFTMKVEVTETQIHDATNGAEIKGNTIILNGIPAVINRDANGRGTYIYDATGENLIYPNDISGKMLYGGSYAHILDEATGKYKAETTESAWVVVLGGNLLSLNGGSGLYTDSLYETGKHLSSTTKNVTVKVYGGTFESIYVAGNGHNTLETGAVAENVHFEMYGGTVTDVFSPLGRNAVVNGKATAILEGGKIVSIHPGSFHNGTTLSNANAQVEIFVGEDMNITTYYGEGRKAVTGKIIHHIPKVNKIENLLITGPQSAVAVDTQEWHLEDVSQFEQFDTLKNPKSPVKFFVGGKEIRVITDIVVTQTEYKVEVGTAFEDIGLPTTFFVDGMHLDGFKWSGTYKADVPGSYAMILVPPANSYLDVAVTVNVTVKKAASFIIKEVITDDAVLAVDNGTTAEEVAELLPVSFEATLCDNSTKTVTDVFEWVCDNYNADRPGNYVFEAVLTDDEYRYDNGAEPFKATVTVKAPAGEGKTVTEILLPVNYTVITSETGTYTTNDGVLNIPFRLWSELDVVVYENGVRSEVTITGVEWESTPGRTDANGTYTTYTIKSYNEMSQLDIMLDIIEEAAVTVYKVNNKYIYNSGAVFCGTSTVLIPLVIKNAGYGGAAIMDATGLNNVASNVRISANGSYCAGSNVDVTGNPFITLEGATVKNVFGGGYNARVTGNATINLKAGTNVRGTVYAGSDNATFVGDATITIEKGAVIGTVYAGSQAGAFIGDIVINIEDGAGIGKFAMDENEINQPNSITINATSNFDTDLIKDLNQDKIRLIIDGVEHHFVSKVEFENRVEVENGAVADYTSVLPDVYVTTAAGRRMVDPADYTWTTEEYDGNKNGEYVFTLTFSENYRFSETAAENNMFVIYVKVAAADYRKITQITTDIPETVAVTQGTPLEEISIIPYLDAYSYRIADQTEADAVLERLSGVKWMSTDYNPDALGKYTATMELPDGYVTDLALPTVEIEVLEVEQTTIVALNIPVKETYFTKGMVTNPVFYDTLEADVIYSDNTTGRVTLTGITWRCKTAYKPSTVGTYEFVIKEIDTPDGYVFRDGVLEETVITVKVINAAYEKYSTRFASTTTTVIPVRVVLDQKTTFATELCDLTGFNKLKKNSMSAYQGVVGGVSHGSVALSGQLAIVEASSGKLNNLVGGSYGSAFTGNAEMNVYGDASIEDVVAGSINHTFNGNTHITLDGEASVRRIVAGSEYIATAKNIAGTAVVGSVEATEYNGTVTVTIRDTFVGALGAIDRSNSDKLILNCPAGFKYENYVDISDPTVEVYVDGVRLNYVSNINEPSKMVYNVSAGTDIQALSLPTTLSATVNGDAAEISGVTWNCDNYDGSVGSYVFTPSIPSYYSVADGMLEGIYVTVRVLSGNPVQTITAFGEVAPVTVPIGTKKSELVLPTTVKATVGGQQVSVEVDSWSCGNYDGSVYGASYTFTATISAEYALSGVAAPTVTVRISDARIVEIYVPVTKTTFPLGAVENPVFYDTLSVKLDNGTVREISGFEWVVEGYNKNTVGTYTAKIKAAPQNYTFAPSMQLPTISVEVSRQTYDLHTTTNMVFLYGIPTVINGDAAGTYLYDITGCNKTHPENISGRASIYAAGAPGSNPVKTTMIEIRGGKVAAVYGGGKKKTRVTDTAYIYMLGGSASAVYGGGYGTKGAADVAVVQNAYVYIENAVISGNLSAAGSESKVIGNTTVIAKNASLNSVIGGSTSSDRNGIVEGKSVLKLLDGVVANVVTGAGSVSVVKESEIYLSKNAVIKQAVIPAGYSDVTGSAKVFYETGFDFSKIYAEDENVKVYEGHFLEDRETFVTDREITIMRNAGLIRGDFHVPFGTAIENLGLPESAVCEINDREVVVDGLKYVSVNNYNGNTPGRYEFELVLPDGYMVPSTIYSKAKTITVVVDETVTGASVTSVYAENESYTVGNGTVIENLNLPTAYRARLSTGKEKLLTVMQWKVADENGRPTEYDRNKQGVYVFTPEFDSAYKMLNTVEIPTYTVKVLDVRPTIEMVSGRRTLYVCGVPAQQDVINGMQIVTDRLGNYIARTSAGMDVYAGASNTLATEIESTDFIMNGGTLRILYPASVNSDVVGTSRLVINGGKITSIYGSSGGYINGVEIIVNGGTVKTLYASTSGYNTGLTYLEINGGTVNFASLGGSSSDSVSDAVPQAEEEILATTSSSGEPVVVKKGEMISAIYVQNGGTVTSLYAAGNGTNRATGSTKMYINAGTAKSIYGTGNGADSQIMGNSYVVLSAAASCTSIFANLPGNVNGKVYVVIPDTFNRYDIIGWDENGSQTGERPGDGELGEEEEGGNEDGSSENTDVITYAAEVVVSGGYYMEGAPVRITSDGTNQTVYAGGIPIRIVPEPEEDVEYEDPADVPTYIYYFDEIYDENETPTEFKYETYVDAAGNPVVLKGVWRKIETPLSSSSNPIIYGGSMVGVVDKYPSTYVEFQGGFVTSIFGGGLNRTAGTANVVLDAQGLHSVTNIYGGGADNGNTAENIHVDIRNGSYEIIYAGGMKTQTRSVLVDMTGGSVNNLYMGGYRSQCSVAGKATLNLTNCSIGTIYGGTFGTSGTVLGDVYINVNENVDMNGLIYPLGSGLRHDDGKTTSGPVSLKAYINIKDADKASQYFKAISYKASQGSRVIVNGVALGAVYNPELATFETAEKKVVVTEGGAYGGDFGMSGVYLNGIPTVIAGDGTGKSYAYQAKTKDGTLNAYQKNEDGTFKYDENGKRISNIVRDPVTGQALKGPKLANTDISKDYVYGGGSYRSVEDVYVEFQEGGVVYSFIGGSIGGHTGYNAQGEEVGLAEARMFAGSVYSVFTVGGVLGNTMDTTYGVNAYTSKAIFLGLGGSTSTKILVGAAVGVLGSEEKFKAGYYNKAGEVLTYQSVFDGQTYEITGTWEDYNLDVTKEDYEAYYESTNARFNGEDNRDFLDNPYYVDPYDDHYTSYCLLSNAMAQKVFVGTYENIIDPVRNSVFGNLYMKNAAYGMRYDAELDIFIEDYNDYGGRSSILNNVTMGGRTQESFNDARIDVEGGFYYKAIGLNPLGTWDLGAKFNGHSYVNLYTPDELYPRETYNRIDSVNSANVTVKENFYPRWSHLVARALSLDEVMPSLALDRGYINESDVKNIRTSMLSATDAAKLLNYYYTGGDVFVDSSNETQTEGFRRVYDASGDKGNFVIRLMDIRHEINEGEKRYTHQGMEIGDVNFLTFPNGQLMLVDAGSKWGSGKVVRNLKYYLESAKEAGWSDGKTIDYLFITHFHSDHYGGMASVIEAFDIKTVIMPPFDLTWHAGYQEVDRAIKAKNRLYAKQGRPEIEILKPKQDDIIMIGEGDEAVEMYVMAPGNRSQTTLSYEQLARKIANGTYDTATANCSSTAARFSYKGQRYVSCADVYDDTEITMAQLYGREFLDCEVLKLNHHGHTSSNLHVWLNACNPDFVIQNRVIATSGQSEQTGKYIRQNLTGNFAEQIYKAGEQGSTRFVLDGETVKVEAQFKFRAYERDTQQYKNLDASYSALLEDVLETREEITVVADGGTAPYGTPYVWQSYANYIDTQLEEFSKRYYSGMMTAEMLESYTISLGELEDFIEASVMTGGADVTPEVSLPGTESGGTGSENEGETGIAGGSQGGIIGDIGGGNAGGGIDGGAGGALGGGAAGGAVGGGDVVGGESTEPDTDDRRFNDVASNDWFNDAVNYVADNNYFNGVSEKEFAPKGTMTRAMLVTVIGRMAGADTSGAENAFDDVDEASWYAEFVAWASANGIVTGTGDNKFAPNANVTREQIAAILMRFTKYRGIDTSVSDSTKYDSMTDTADVSEYAVEAMKWATSYGVINGSNGKLNPKGIATRAEVAQMITNYCKTFAI